MRRTQGSTRSPGAILDAECLHPSAAGGGQVFAPHTHWRSRLREIASADFKRRWPSDVQHVLGHGSLALTPTPTYSFRSHGMEATYDAGTAYGDMGVRIPYSQVRALIRVGSPPAQVIQGLGHGALDDGPAGPAREGCSAPQVSQIASTGARSCRSAAADRWAWSDARRSRPREPGAGPRPGPSR
jgi:hypothetical protein